MSNKKPPSQETRLLAWLRNGMTITRLLALTELGIFELSARIKSLEAAGRTTTSKTIARETNWLSRKATARAGTKIAFRQPNRKKRKWARAFAR